MEKCFGEEISYGKYSSDYNGKYSSDYLSQIDIELGIFFIKQTTFLLFEKLE